MTVRFHQTLLQFNLSYYYNIYPDTELTFYYAMFHPTILNCCPSFQVKNLCVLCSCEVQKILDLSTQKM